MKKLPRAKWPRPRKPGETRVRPKCTVAGGQITLLIDEPTPSLNQTMHWHFGAKAKHRARWAKLMMVAGSAPEAVGPRSVEVWRYGDRDLDVDNLAGGAKSVLLDNLVKRGLLVDDSAKWARVTYHQARPDKGFYPYTVVVLRDLETQQ